MLYTNLLERTQRSNKVNYSYSYMYLHGIFSSLVLGQCVNTTINNVKNSVLKNWPTNRSI